jgi:hypothetical protein
LAKVVREPHSAPPPLSALSVPGRGIASRLNAPKNRRTTAVALFVLLWLGLVVPLRIWRTDVHGSFNATFYDELAEAFMAGRTHLQPPPPGLLALPDPWDAATNERFRIWDDPTTRRYEGRHDLSLYKGRLYLEWGPVPALLLMPFKLFTPAVVPPGWVALVALMLAQLLLAVSVLMMTTPRGGAPSPLLVAATVVTLGLEPHWSAVLNRVAVYEMAIAVDQLFFALFIFALCLAFRRAFAGQREPWLLAVAGLALGLEAGSRINHMALGLLVPVIWVVWCRIHPRLNVKQALAHGLAIGLPALACVAAIFAYNYARFDRILDFGQHWQLWAGPDPMPRTSFRFLESARILPNVYYNFLVGPDVLRHFPFFRVTTPFPLGWMSADQISRYAYYPPGRTSGLFAVAPLAVLVFATPFFWRSGRRAIGDVWRPGITLTLLASGAALLLAGQFLAAPAGMRYSSDWALVWLTAALAATGLVLQWSRSWRRGPRVAVQLSILLGTAWTSALGIAYCSRASYGG